MSLLYSGKWNRSHNLSTSHFWKRDNNITRVKSPEETVSLLTALLKMYSPNCSHSDSSNACVESHHLSAQTLRGLPLFSKLNFCTVYRTYLQVPQCLTVCLTTSGGSFPPTCPYPAPATQLAFCVSNMPRYSALRSLHLLFAVPKTSEISDIQMVFFLTYFRALFTCHLSERLLMTVHYLQQDLLSTLIFILPLLYSYSQS